MSYRKGGPMATEAMVNKIRRRYMEALLRGEEADASSSIAEGLKRGLTAAQLYLGVLAPAQVEIGRLWCEGRLNVAHEHWSTQVTLEQMEVLSRALPKRPRLGVRAVIAAVDGELHSLGARMVADFLYMDGWEVEFLGGNTPGADLVQFVRREDPGLVGLSATLVPHLAQVREAVSLIRRLIPPPKVLVGGGAFHGDRNSARSVGADGFASDADEAVKEARRLLGLDGDVVRLDNYSILLGKRIRSLRRARGWSQGRLAEETGLNRAYISLLENGKGNPTLAAMVKLGGALGVTPDDLLIAEERLA